MTTSRKKLQRPEIILHPMYRWRSGHQLFFTSIQTLNILFKMVEESVDNKEWDLANKYIKKICFLYEHVSKKHRIRFQL